MVAGFQVGSESPSAEILSRADGTALKKPASACDQSADARGRVRQTGVFQHDYKFRNVAKDAGRLVELAGPDEQFENEALLGEHTESRGPS